MHIATLASSRRKKIPIRISWNFCKSLGRTALLALALALPLCCAAQARWIRVGVATRVAQTTVSGTGLTAQDAAGRKAALPAAFSAQARGGAVMIHGRAYKSPVIIRSAHPIAVGKIKYDGEIVLRATGNALTAVNRLDVEKYLRGVLGFEINPAWNIEVLKAQAVISRTFALAQFGRHNNDGYDVCTGDHCQVYRGANVHSARTDDAIVQTRGRVITYRGQLANVFFCSESGGATADVADVWGSSVPYLVVRTEPFPSESNHNGWQVDLTAEEIRAALAKKGVYVGVPQSVSIIRRDAAGRSAQLRITGTAGSGVISSASFRMALGGKKLRSTFFDFTPGVVAPHPVRSPDVSAAAHRTGGHRKAAAGASLTPEEEKQLKALVAQKKFSVDDRLDMLLHPESRRSYLERFVKVSSTPQKDAQPALIEQPKTPEPAPDSQKTLFTDGITTGTLVGGVLRVYGNGWGHGVGMSQWGARAMADHGWTAQQILDFYFPGTVITTQ